MDGAQVQIEQERAQIVEQDDFAALVRALRRAQGFALYFVECNVPAYRKEVADAVRERLDRPVVDIHLGEVERQSERSSVDSILEEQLKDASEEAAAFVWELEWLLPTTEVDRDVAQATLKEVNWRRGAYARLDRPVVVWLPEYAIRYLARNAPDFFDWNSGLYVFDTPESDRPEMFETSLDLLERESSVEGIPTEEKRRREAYLKSLLEEYSSEDDFDRSARADILLRLAKLYLDRAIYDAAQSCAQQALEVSRTMESRRMEARARHQLAMIALRQGDYAEARSEFKEALQIRQDVGDRKGEAATRAQLATIALQRGNYDKARLGFGKALEILRQIGDLKKEATTLAQLGILAADKLGRPEEGVRLLHVSYTILTSIEHVQAEQVESWIGRLIDKLGYDEEEWQDEVEYAQQSYAEDRGWNLIQEAFPDADIPDEIPSG